MTEDDEKPLTLSREDLYELVWSKPMRDLAADFGISDVGLAKRCRRLGIPVPGRGYWARVDAGQQPHRPKLPKREPHWFDDGALTVAPSQPGRRRSRNAPSKGRAATTTAGPHVERRRFVGGRNRRLCRGLNLKVRGFYAAVPA